TIGSGCGLSRVSREAKRSNKNHIKKITTITAATMPMPTSVTARTSTSRFSGLVPSMFQRLFQFRIVHGQQRALLQLVEERRQPDSAQRRRRRDIEPTQPETSQPKQVHDPHEDQHRRYRHHPFAIPLELARQEQQERQREMKHYQRQA